MQHIQLFSVFCARPPVPSIRSGRGEEGREVRRPAAAATSCPTKRAANDDHATRYGGQWRTNSHHLLLLPLPLSFALPFSPFSLLLSFFLRSSLHIPCPALPPSSPTSISFSLALLLSLSNYISCYSLPPFLHYAFSCSSNILLLLFPHTLPSACNRFFFYIFSLPPSLAFANLPSH